MNLTPEQREARRLAMRRFHERHRERRNAEARERARNLTAEQRDKRNAYARGRRPKRLEWEAKQSPEWWEHRREINRRWRENASEEQREKGRECRRRYRKRMPKEVSERVRARARERSKEPDAAFERRENARSRYRSNPNHRLSTIMSVNVRSALLGTRKREPTFKMLGYSVDDLRAHLERTMQRGMTWGNYGKRWHIDHIVPQSAFDQTDPEQFRRCWALTNLRALGSRQNQIKHAKTEHLL
jgi:hypothetical protein